jgi:hypothetical protein
MLALARAGHIELPDTRFKVRNHLAERPRPEPVVPDNGPVRGPLRELGPLTFEQVRRTPQEALFNMLVEQYHYLCYEQPVGEHLKYLVSAKEQAIACLAWCSAPRHLASRDRFIGWNAKTRKRNLHLLACNTRFLILPWVQVPHLPRTFWDAWRRSCRAIGRIYMRTLCTGWKHLSIRRGSKALVIWRLTGWSWDAPQDAVTMHRRTRQRNQ